MIGSYVVILLALVSLLMPFYLWWTAKESDVVQTTVEYPEKEPTVRRKHTVPSDEDLEVLLLLKELRRMNCQLDLMEDMVRIR